jgi:hypothetical protein
MSVSTGIHEVAVTALARTHYPPRPGELVDWSKPLYDSEGFEHLLVDLGGHEAVTKHSFAYCVWNRETGQCQRQGADGLVIGNTPMSAADRSRQESQILSVLRGEQPAISSPVSFGPLTHEQRRDLIAYLVARAMNGNPLSVTPDTLANIATQVDEDLLATCQEYEHDGDAEASEVLGRLGLSGKPVEVVFGVKHKAPDGTDLPRVVAVPLLLNQVLQLMLDHGAVRDMPDFASLRMEVKQYRLEPLGEMLGDVLAANAVLQTNSNGQATVHFNFEVARPGNLDLDIYSLPCSLEYLADRVRQAVTDRHDRLYIGCDAAEAEHHLAEPADEPRREAQRG